MKNLARAIAAIALIGTPAVAADMPVKAPPPAPPPVLSWTGWYVGLNAGGTWYNNSVTTTSRLVSNFTTPGADTFGPNSAAGANGVIPVGRSGFIGGAQLGYNWQIGRAVAGFEADIQGIGPSNSGRVTTVVGPFDFGAPEVLTTTITSSTQIKYFGTARGRFGFLATPSLLLYATGGLAYGGVKADTSILQSNNDCAVFSGRCLQPSVATAGSASSTRAGWTLGVGSEWKLSQNWSAKLEYLYYDLGTVTFPVGPLVTPAGVTGAGGSVVVASQSTTHFNGNIARVGLNYSFH